MSDKLTHLKSRLDLFNRIPSGTNMILAYKLIEDLILKIYQENQVELDARQVEKFDKLKNLALSTKFIEERKLAFSRSFEIFKKLTQIKEI